MQYPLASLQLKILLGKFCRDPVAYYILHISRLLKRFLTYTYRNNYATFQKIKTETVEVSGNKGDSKKAKLFITLKKSPQFSENMAKFNKIREENEALAKKGEETKQ